MPVQIGQDAPDFILCGNPADGFPAVTLAESRGKFVCLAFFPAAFSGSPDQGCEMQALTQIFLLA